MSTLQVKMAMRLLNDHKLQGSVEGLNGGISGVNRSSFLQGLCIALDILAFPSALHGWDSHLFDGAKDHNSILSSITALLV